MRIKKSCQVTILTAIYVSGISTVNGIALANEINIYNWEGYIDQKVIQDFENQTGHTITIDTYDNDSIRDEVINSGRAFVFDLILLDSWSLKSMGAKGLLYDLSPLTNELSNVIDVSRQNDCGQFGLPYTWGTMGIAYRKSVARTPITSWKQLFNPPSEHHQRVVFSEDLVDAVASALLASNLPPFSSNENDLKTAYTLLQQQKPHVLSYEFGESYGLIYGSASQMSMTLAFTGEHYYIAEYTEQDDWQYVVPDEGSLIWTECFAVPKSEKINSAALEFLRYLNKPEIAARNAESIWFATPNQAALPLTTEEYQQDQSIFPSADVLSRSIPYQPLNGDAQLIREKMIQAVKR
ncbi:spermidine/putrescine ABC transporter substrate-binding protein [Vibrio sp. 99-70-13A1]|uniref:polyamine ABC transporter substrate-binding protein n=1 Tax=Vibrio sp. 99-70-13A1 TaxID=2607601 RepID=UPI001493763D|nr:spermidine/putrescine ABC transporter substrate-binding protein [Vibrio sp. 99-70-13A1]NOH95523.1 spermidine/putrescine ABC transporter substrate-binding protein [Vibrio sp. 99-70-13A1]